MLEMGEKKKSFSGAWRDCKETRLRKVRKMEEAEDVCKEWNGVYCLQKAFAEQSLEK